MTNLEALKAKIGYPLTDNSFELALVGRSLTSSATYAGESSLFELAYADCLTTLLTVPSTVQEGGYSVSISEKKTLADLIDKIYAKHDEASPVTKPTVKFVQRW